MNAKNSALPRSLTSDLVRVDAHVVNVAEYDELPELDEAMLARAHRQPGRATHINQPAQTVVDSLACRCD
jgi:hypothetical protein